MCWLGDVGCEVGKEPLWWGEKKEEAERSLLFATRLVCVSRLCWRVKCGRALAPPTERSPNTTGNWTDKSLREDVFQPIRFLCWKLSINDGLFRPFYQTNNEHSWMSGRMHFFSIWSLGSCYSQHFLGRRVVPFHETVRLFRRNEQSLARMVSVLITASCKITRTLRYELIIAVLFS